MQNSNHDDITIRERDDDKKILSHRMYIQWIKKNHALVHTHGGEVTCRGTQTLKFNIVDLI